MLKVYRTRIAPVLFVILVMTLAISICQPARAEMNIAPDRLVLNAKLSDTKTTSIKCIFGYYMSSDQQLGPDFELALNLVDSVDGVTRTYLLDAIGIRYCPIDENIIVAFDRRDTQKVLTLNDTPQGEVQLLLEGWFQVVQTHPLTGEPEVLIIDVEQTGTIEIAVSKNAGKPRAKP